MRWGGALIACAGIAALIAASVPRGGGISWSTSAELAQPRAYASAALLPTGEIFVFGGLDENDPAVVNATTELVDTAAGTVREVPQPAPGRLHHTLTLADEDTLVVAGGVEWYQDKFHSSDRVDVYLPFEHAWKRAAPLLQARSDHGAAPLPGGRVLVTGGNFGTLPLASSEIYDPRTNAWHIAAPLPEPRVRFSIAALPDGRVLVAGGLSKIGKAMGTSVIYDPAKDTWSSGPDMFMPRVEQAMVQLRDGDVLFIGGQDAASTTAERYSVASNTFTLAGSLVEPRLIEQAALLPDGRVLITGGSRQIPERANWVPVNNAEIWDPATNGWSAFKSPTLNRALGDLVVAGKDAYLIGGITDDLAALRAIERLSYR
jgi:Kelch motif protein/galactose oxidase-like protein